MASGKDRISLSLLRHKNTDLKRKEEYIQVYRQATNCGMSVQYRLWFNV